MTDAPDSTTVSGAWRFPGSQDLGHVMFMAGIGIALYGLSAVGYPSLILPLLLVVVGVILAERGGTRFFINPPDEPELPPMDMSGDFPPMDFGTLSEVPPSLTGPGAEDAQRVLDVVRASWPDDLEPVWDEFEIDDDVLMKYAFRATRAGFFTDDAAKKRVSEKLSKAVTATRGAWATTFDMKRDTITVTQRSSLPGLALPPEWEVVKSADQAGRAYRKFGMTLGPGESDNMVSFKPQVFPHVAVIATSGGGKSVFLRACIEQMRALGGMIITGDGKGSDYSTLRNEPGIIAIGRGSGQKGVEYAAAIELGFRLMQQRQNTAAERKTADPAGWEDIPPVFLILDELKSVLKKWSTELDRKSFKSIESKVNQILALGRQMR